nr:MAG: ORF1 [Torque teno midi virus]
MPFWWRRRRKPWFGRWRGYKRRLTTRKRRRRPYKRRRTTRYNRRRRRRRKYKVRKKRKTLPVQQWQPDSIRKCKIKGLGLLVLGAEGKQMDCFSVEKQKYVPPKNPGGGGFGCETYSLEYLYDQWVFHNNIWTHTNINRDLCRYLWCKIVVFRHPHTDFIVQYDRQPPFDLTKETYPSCHPQQMLLQKHHKIILSRDSKPNGKYSKKFIIKPPKQMLTKWFFTHEFCKYDLFLIKAAAASFRFGYLSCCNQSQLVNIYSLNTYWYQDASWGQNRQETTPYLPIPTLSKGFAYQVKTNTGYQKVTMPDSAFNSRAASLAHETGWFRSSLLQATAIYSGAQITATTPVVGARYNPTIDTGKNNKIYLSSITTTHYDPPTVDKSILIEGMPLWLGLYGFLSYVETIKTAPGFLDLHVVLLQSPAILCSQVAESCKIFLPLDLSFIKGQNPWDQPVVRNHDLANWYPTIKHQRKALNAIIESGPFIPKYPETKDSTWELKMKYSFLFKWGGPETTDEVVKDPYTFTTYDVPDKVSKTVQIQNPTKQIPGSSLYPWDYRRGLIKNKALKRMQDNQSTDTEFEYVAEGLPPKKKKRQGNHLRNPQEETEEIQTCLQQLFEENTFQEMQTEEDIHLLIQQQHQQQQQIKRDILKLIMNIKHKQNLLSLHTGMIT